jgi:hypothetical protein
MKWGPSAAKWETCAGGRRRAALAALAWGLLFFAGAQLALALAMEHWRPELRDPEYGAKRARLRALLAKKPGHPLLLVLGSSRADLGIHPAALPLLPAVSVRGGAPAEPLVFNASLMGAGPVLQLLCLRRLLGDGFRPDWVVVECWPPYLSQEGNLAEIPRLPVSRLAWGDVRVLRRYHPQPGQLCQEWCLARLTPWSSSRFTLLVECSRECLPMMPRQDDLWKLIDSSGWLPFQGSPTPREVRAHVERVHDLFDPLLSRFHVSEISDRALRETVAVCRREGIGVALLVMPESREFQGWYPPAARAVSARYIDRLSRECRVPVIDARDWCADEDFADGYHLLPPAADRFTEHLGREGLGPFLVGTPSPAGLRPSP